MRSLIVLLLLLLGSVHWAHSQTTFRTSAGEYPMYSESRALLVFVSDYEAGADWDRLTLLPARVSRLSAFLELVGFETQILENPNGTELRESVRVFLAEAPENSRSIIYFAGHGWTDPSNPRLGYIVPRDAPNPDTRSKLDPSLGRMIALSEADQQSRLRSFRSRALSTYDMRAMSKTASGRHTLFLLDSCFSAAVFGTMSSSHLRLPRSELWSMSTWDNIGSRAFQYMTAGDGDQRVPQDNPFVEEFINGLQGAADWDENGIVLAGDLALYMKSRIRQKAGLYAQYGHMPLSEEFSWSSPVGGDMAFQTIDPADERFRDFFAGGGAPPEKPTADPISYSGTAEKPRIEHQYLDNAVFELQQNTEVTNMLMLAEVQHEVTEDDVRSEIDKLRDLALYNSHPILGEYNIVTRFEDLDIRYYRKDNDVNKVTRVLGDLSIPFRARPSQLTWLSSNAIACHPTETDIDVVKSIAIELLRNGVQIRRIQQFRNADWDRKRNRIEIIAVAAAEAFPVLSEEQIMALNSCPVEMSGGAQ